MRLVRAGGEDRLVASGVWRGLVGGLVNIATMRLGWWCRRCGWGGDADVKTGVMGVEGLLPEGGGGDGRQRQRAAVFAVGSVYFVTKTLIN